MTNPMLSRIRRNHALEHASIHVLTEKHKGFSAQGNSTATGFNLNIYGQVDDDAVTQAVYEAHQRLKGGESRLAVHPNCGTVLLTTASVATLSVLATLGIEQQRQKKSKMNLPVIITSLPSAVLAATLSLIVAKPLGIFLQERYTVESDLGGLEIVAIERVRPSLVTRIFQLLLGQARNNEVQAFKIETIG